MVLFASLAMAVPLGAAGGGGAPVGGRAGAARGGAPGNLRGAMESMQASVLALKRDGADPEKIEQNLRTLAQMQRDVAIAKMQNPPVQRITDPAKQATGAETFRLAMSSIQRTLLDLEDAVIAKKPDDIKRLIAKLDEIERNGHRLFGMDG
jgi:hypothetical protein